MSEEEALPAQWPWPVRIEAVDPYPWHGLVYNQSGTVWLQPMGLRPRLPLPARPSGIWGFSERPVQQPNPALWDVGLPQPPFSQELYDAGADSWSKRLLPSSSGLTRLNGESRVVFWRSMFGGGYELVEVERITGDQTVVATFDVPWSTVFGGLSELKSPSGSVVELVPEGLITQLTRSHDGTRRLCVARASYTGGWSFIVGVFEVVISATEGWEYSVSINVLANTAACLGTYTYERDSALSSAVLSPVTGDLEYTSIASSAQVVPGVTHNLVTGTYHEKIEHAGRIVGAYYDDDDAVQFVRMTQTYTRDETCSAAGTFAEKWEPTDTSFTKDTWVITGTKTRTNRYEYTIGGNSQAIEHVFEYTGDVDFAEIEVGGEQQRSGTVTGTNRREVLGTPLLSEITGTETDEEIVGFSFQWGPSAGAAVPRDSEAVYGPEETRTLNVFEVREANTDSQLNQVGNLVKGFYAKGAGNIYLTPVLTPGGSVGGTVVRPDNVTTSERAFYNPLTGDGIRSAENLDKTILGYL